MNNTDINTRTRWYDPVVEAAVTEELHPWTGRWRRLVLEQGNRGSLASRALP
ncbi:hypothetical protein [Streptomyces sp. NPDC047042]|uniref:hypothetical protein n=1 Tax=Streptomyces sp. NPDC047042 TaxID=3154807 RepID=UPI0033DDA865